MDSLGGISFARPVMRCSARFLRRAGNDLASLRPAIVDVIIIFVFGVIIGVAEYFYDLRQDFLNLQLSTETVRSII
jgi:hypothetical protein